MNISKLESGLFCPECLHVYYMIPDNGKCAICDNEITHESTISPMNILTCETCHSLYSTQKMDEIIPQNMNNPNYLCKCVHNCPTNSILSVGFQETFVGNIVRADIYQCSNCGAITFQNAENREKDCKECGSRYVFPLHWTPEDQKIIYNCANPKHGIRQKIRDIIQDINDKISQKMVNYKELDKNLQNNYLVKKKKIEEKYAEMNVSDKLKNQLKKITKRDYDTQLNELQTLNKWALQERIKIYNQFLPLSARCSVYQKREEGNNSFFIKTTQGCNALAKIRVRKIIEAPDGTVIDRPYPTPIQPSSSFPVENHESIAKNMNNIPNWRDSLVPLSAHQDRNLISRIVEAFENSNPRYLDEKLTEKQLQKFDIDGYLNINEILEYVPKLSNKQFYICLGLYQQLSDNEDYILNIGIIPVEFNSYEEEIRIGREHLVGAYWIYPEFFSKHPYIFENFTPVKDSFSQFSIIPQIDSSFLINSSENNINQTYINISGQEDSLKILNSPTLMEKNLYLILEGFYPLQKDKERLLNKYSLKLTLIYPKSIQNL